MTAITLLTDYPPMKGGIAGYAGELVRLLKKEIDVHVISFKEVKGEDYVDNFLFDKRKIRKYVRSRVLSEIIAIPYWIYAGARLMFKVFRNKSDVVHLQYEIGTFHVLVLPFLLLLRLFGVKTVVTHHEHYGNALDRLSNFFIRHFDAIIVHTKEHRKALLRARIKPSKIRVIPFGIRPFKSIPSRKNHQTALIMGYFLPRKGYVQAIHAFAKVVGDLPKAKLLIAGEPAPSKAGRAYYRKMVQAIKQHNLGANVSFLGYVQEKDFSKLFSKVDVVLMPYVSITQSAALFDTLAYCKPVIASNIPGFSEFIQEGVNGHLVNPKDSKDFSKKILSLLGSHEKAKRIEKNNKKLLEKYGWDNIINKYIEVYKN